MTRIDGRICATIAALKEVHALGAELLERPLIYGQPAAVALPARFGPAPPSSATRPGPSRLAPGPSRLGPGPSRLAARRPPVPAFSHESAAAVGVSGGPSVKSPAIPP